MKPAASPPTEPPREPDVLRTQVEEYSPIVRRCAMVLARKAAPAVTVSELCECGFAALVDALVSAGSGAEGDALDRYVRHRIRSAMTDHIREHRKRV